MTTKQWPKFLHSQEPTLQRALTKRALVNPPTDIHSPLTRSTTFNPSSAPLCSPCSPQPNARTSSLRSRPPTTTTPLTQVGPSSPSGLFNTTQIRSAILLDIHLASTNPNSRLRRPTPAKEWPHSPLTLDTNQFIGRRFLLRETSFTIVMIAPFRLPPP